VGGSPEGLTEKDTRGVGTSSHRKKTGSFSPNVEKEPEDRVISYGEENFSYMADAPQSKKSVALLALQKAAPSFSGRQKKTRKGD